MSGLLGLFLGWLLFSQPPEPKCPLLRDERVATWSSEPYMDNAVCEKTATGAVCHTFGTTTLDSFGNQIYQTGYATSTAAVEHNKRVQECRTLNGEF